MGQWIETLDRLVWGPGLLAALLFRPKDKS